MTMQTGENDRRHSRTVGRGPRAAVGMILIRLLLLVQPLLAALLFFCLAGLACAAPGVSMEPGQTTASPDDEFELSFRVDDCGDSVASYQLYMSFDPEVVELVEATEGSLYVESGLMTWFIEEEVEPGFWHFFDTVFGSGTYVSPPGELLHLKFSVPPDAIGCTQARVDTIRLTDALRDPLPVGSVGNGCICVPSTAVQEGLDSERLGPPVPNPFAGGTSIPFSLTRRSASLEIRVYDAAGRLVRKLPVPSTTRRGEVEWDGRAGNGTVAAPGVYFIELDDRQSNVRTKATKLR